MILGTTWRGALGASQGGRTKFRPVKFLAQSPACKDNKGALLLGALPRWFFVPLLQPGASTAVVRACIKLHLKDHLCPSQVQWWTFRHC